MTDVLKASRLLNAVTTFDIVTKQLVETVEAIFHIEDLFTLAKGNSFVALNYFQLICNLDYVIFTPIPALPVGIADTGIGADILYFFGISGSETRYPLTLKGKLAAIAECFRLQSIKMDKMITTDTLTAFMQGTGAAQIAQDAVNALLKGGGGGELAKAALPLVAGI